MKAYKTQSPFYVKKPFPEITPYKCKTSIQLGNTKISFKECCHLNKIDLYFKMAITTNHHRREIYENVFKRETCYTCGKYCSRKFNRFVRVQSVTDCVVDLLLLRDDRRNCSKGTKGQGPSHWVIRVNHGKHSPQKFVHIRDFILILDLKIIILAMSMQRCSKKMLHHSSHCIIS